MMKDLPELLRERQKSKASNLTIGAMMSGISGMYVIETTGYLPMKKCVCLAASAIVAFPDNITSAPDMLRQLFLFSVRFAAKNAVGEFIYAKRYCCGSFCAIAYIEPESGLYKTSCLPGRSYTFPFV